jgi:hypothetical protein
MRLSKIALSLLLALACAKPARADFWGGDIPLLIEIVANTLNTLNELRNQSEMLRKELRGIDDKIYRLRTIQEIIAPNDLAQWKDPREALRRLQRIYYTMPPEFRTEKSDEIERRLSQAMSVAGILVDSAKPAFSSGKQLEKEGLVVGPAVANKMTASGVGTLVALESQNQVAQATIISLLSQMIAENGSKEAARLNSQSREYKSMGSGLTGFSKQINLMEVSR